MVSCHHTWVPSIWAGALAVGIQGPSGPAASGVPCVSSPSGDRLDPTAVNILQQIIELGSEAHDATAVASVVAMAPGTVTVVKQVRPSPRRVTAPQALTTSPAEPGTCGSVSRVSVSPCDHHGLVFPIAPCLGCVSGERCNVFLKILGTFHSFPLENPRVTVSGMRTHLGTCVRRRPSGPEAQ